MSKARDSIEDLKTIDANFAAKAPLASPTFTGPLTSESAAATNIVAKSTNGNGGYMNFQGLASNGTQTFGVNHNGTIFTTSGLAVGGVGANNTLDDYEEGTWTPTDSSGAGLTLSVSGANYVKVGTLIHVTAYLNFPSNSNGAGVRLNGLPFTTKNNQNYSYLMGRSAIGGIMLQVDNHSTTFDIRPADSDNGVTNSQISNSHILFSGTYITA